MPRVLSGSAPLITAGNFSLDDTVNPDGEACAAPGGDALYSAVGAATWRCPVSAMARVGADYPAEFMDRIASLGIGIETVRVLAGPSVHYRITNAPSGGREYEHLTPARRLHELSPQGADLDVVSQASWLHVAAMPLELQEAVIARCRAERVPYSLDPHEEYIVGYEARVRDLVRDSVFMPSELEVVLMFPDLAGEQPPGVMAHTAASRLLDMGARAVAIKLGAAGCLVADSGGRTALPALSIAVVDSTGAGDAFCGGFLAGYLRTSSLLAAAVCGTLSAAHVVRGFGAFHSEFPTPATLREQAALLLRNAEEAGATTAALHDGFPWLGSSPEVYEVEPTSWGRLVWMVSGRLHNSDKLTVGRCYIAPGEANPRHSHPNCDEVLHVLHGDIEHSLNDDTFRLSAGETISIPMGSVHNARNLGAEEAVMLIVFSSPDRQTIAEPGGLSR